MPKPLPKPARFPFGQVLLTHGASAKLSLEHCSHGLLLVQLGYEVLARLAVF